MYYNICIIHASVPPGPPARGAAALYTLVSRCAATGRNSRRRRRDGAAKSGHVAVP